MLCLPSAATASELKSVGQVSISVSRSVVITCSIGLRKIKSVLMKHFNGLTHCIENVCAVAQPIVRPIRSHYIDPSLTDKLVLPPILDIDPATPDKIKAVRPQNVIATSVSAQIHSEIEFEAFHVVGQREDFRFGKRVFTRVAGTRAL